MKDINIVSNKIDKAIKEITKFIESESYKKYSISYETLERFKRYFTEIKKDLAENKTFNTNLRPYVGQIITDSWPYNISISELLIDAEQSYFDLK